MQPNLCVRIGKINLKNPVMVSSGTFGYAEEFRDFFALSKLGAVVSKTITLKPRQGNAPPRTCETPSGLLNAVGLQNPGLRVFLLEKLPLVTACRVPVIVSIASQSKPEEFVQLAKALERVKAIAAIELNISCPNIKSKSAKLISQDAGATYNLVREVRKVTKKTLITKLSPNVTDIAEIASAAEKGGADALSLINTITAMKIDISQRKPMLSAVTGGLSGPAVRPVAVRMVWEVFKKVSIPIIGMGGITDYRDALEFIIAGASAVSVGTQNFVNPCVAYDIINGISGYLKKNKLKSIKPLIGSLRL